MKFCDKKQRDGSPCQALGSYWGQSTQSFPGAAGGHCTNIFKAPPTSNTQILTPERSSRIIHEVSVRSLCTRKSTGSSGWTLRTKTNQFSLLKLLTLAEQIFRKSPRDLLTWTCWPWGSRASTSHVCTQVTAGQAHGWG